RPRKRGTRSECHPLRSSVHHDLLRARITSFGPSVCAASLTLAMRVCRRQEIHGKNFHLCFWREIVLCARIAAVSRDGEEGLLRGAIETLRPIVRRLLASGVPFGVLETRLRELVVEVAESDLAIAGRRQTDSRIALVTGINRKEVRRMRARASQPVEHVPSFGRNQAATLVSRWRAGPRATDRNGR